jgi:hypothetical protein
MKIISKPQSVNNFYFFEYFYVLLKSIQSYSNQEKIFDSFKSLKQEHLLGESKYKKLTFDKSTLTKTQVDRYRYTFEQVIDEAKAYGLIQKKGKDLFLSADGEEVLLEYKEKGLLAFNKRLFHLMEIKYGAFYYMVDFCYRANPQKSGLLIFPNYSPLKLGFERANIKTTSDIFNFSRILVKRLEEDIKTFIGEARDLKKANALLLGKLKKGGLLSDNSKDKFDPQKYNAIIKGFRDHWLNYFLREIYAYEHSLRSFDIWVYRGKQVGILHATEFYPYFSGRIVYPTSILIDFRASKDFHKIFDYTDGKSLYIHYPSWENTQEDFIKSLTNAYFDIRKTHRNYFISLADVRELVCYKLKIPEHLFDSFLKKAYKLNLEHKLNIAFSLEADKLPQETNAMYLKREPIKIDERYRNIIAIDITKGERKYDRFIKKTN